MYMIGCYPPERRTYIQLDAAQDISFARKAVQSWGLRGSFAFAFGAVLVWFVISLIMLIGPRVWWTDREIIGPRMAAFRNICQS